MSCPIYLINLPRDEQRLRVMQQQLDAMQLPFRRMDAVYGKDLSAAERASLYDEARNRRSYHQIMTPGEIGCYASHLRVWQDLAASPHAHALVLEDDVELLPQLPAVLAAMDELAPQWDMIKLVGRDHERSLRAWRTAFSTVNSGSGFADQSGSARPGRCTENHCSVTAWRSFSPA